MLNLSEMGLLIDGICLKWLDIDENDSTLLVIARHVHSSAAAALA